MIVSRGHARLLRAHPWRARQGWTVQSAGLPDRRPGRLGLRVVAAARWHHAHGTACGRPRATVAGCLGGRRAVTAVVTVSPVTGLPVAGAVSAVPVAGAVGGLPVARVRVPVATGLLIAAIPPVAVARIPAWAAGVGQWIKLPGPRAVAAPVIVVGC